MADHVTDAQVGAFPVTDYATVRPGLVSGDLFFCSGNYLVSKAIRRFTNSPWSHVGIVFVAQTIDRVLLLESVEDVGVRFAPVSKYLTDYDKGQPYDGVLAFARTTAATLAAVTALAEFGCDQLTLPYDNEEIADIVSRIALHLGRPQPTSGYICSELVYACFRSAGYEFGHTDDFVTPEDIWRDPSVALLARVQ